MSFLDSLFGGTSRKGQFEVRNENDRNRDIMLETAALGRQDVLGIIPRGQESLQQGYRAAIDVARRTPQAQNRVLQHTSQRAQEALLAGMGEYKRAILGQDSMQGPNMYANPLGMRPQRLGVQGEPNKPFTDSQRPMFLGTQEGDAVEAALRANPAALEAAIRENPGAFTGAAPEQFREGVRYDFNKKTGEGTLKGGASQRPYVNPLAGINWSSF